MTGDSGPHATPGSSLNAALPRVRVTTHMPLLGTRVGLTLWVGSVKRGWKGWPVFRRGFTYSVGGVTPPWVEPWWEESHDA